MKGQPAHSSQIFRSDIGAGAIFEAARVLNAFRDKLSTEPHLTFNPGTIVGGTSVEHDPVQTKGTAFGKTNVIAEHAIVQGDMRTLSPEQLAERQEGDGGDRQDVAAAHAVHDHLRGRLSAAGADRR